MNQTDSVEPSAKEPLAEKKTSKANHWARLAALLFLIMAVSGFLRFYGALSQRAVLLRYGLTLCQYRYLMVAGLAYGILNLSAFVLILIRSRLQLIGAWIVAFLSVAYYWFERFVLWAPEQRSGNILFMILLHLALLLVLIFFWLVERKHAAKSEQP